MKRIGISLRVENIEKYNEKRDSISHDWITFLENLNYFPILIPNKLKNVDFYISKLNLDGIILSGGDNVGEFPERDETENIILKYAIKNSIPVLGVCRGMQLINYFFHGKIIKNNDSSHVGKPHRIDILNNKMIEMFKNEKLQVNSFHNNIITKEHMASELDVFALSENDKTIEGYFHPNHPIVGVMWHPERDQKTEFQSKIIDMLYNKEFWKLN